eukprot:4084517-Pyramimonas_sp.AAC.1
MCIRDRFNTEPVERDAGACRVGDLVGGVADTRVALSVTDAVHEDDEGDGIAVGACRVEELVAGGVGDTH